MFAYFTRVTASEAAAAAVAHDDRQRHGADADALVRSSGHDGRKFARRPKRSLSHSQSSTGSDTLCAAVVSSTDTSSPLPAVATDSEIAINNLALAADELPPPKKPKQPNNADITASKRSYLQYSAATEVELARSMHQFCIARQASHAAAIRHFRTSFPGYTKLSEVALLKRGRRLLADYSQFVKEALTLTKSSAMTPVQRSTSAYESADLRMLRDRELKKSTLYRSECRTSYPQVALVQLTELIKAMRATGQELSFIRLHKLFISILQQLHPDAVSATELCARSMRRVFGRANIVQRRITTTSTKATTSEMDAKIKENFLNRIATILHISKITRLDRMINADHTPVLMSPTANVTYDLKGVKSVSATTKDEKAQITGLLAVTAEGESVSETLS